MSAHVLLNLVNKLGKRDKMLGLPSILSLFHNKFNEYKSTDVRFYLSYEIKITLKSHFCRKNGFILSLCMQRYYERHNVTRKFVNHYSCIETHSDSCFNNGHCQMNENPCSNLEIYVLFEHGFKL